MAAKAPVVLVVLIETSTFRWFVGSIGLDGAAVPHLCSEAGNLAGYRGGTLDEQTTFLRHRFAGVLQRGCDRLWSRQEKPCQVVFVSDGRLIDAEAGLEQRIGEHFVEWMARPPVAFFATAGGFHDQRLATLTTVAGGLDATLGPVLESGLVRLFSETETPESWELIPTPPAR
jgi:hypothetical protein